MHRFSVEIAIALISCSSLLCAIMISHNEGKVVAYSLWPTLRYTFDRNLSWVSGEDCSSLTTFLNAFSLPETDILNNRRVKFYFYFLYLNFLNRVTDL